MAKKIGFDKAYEELQEIVQSLQDEEAGIDTLSVKLKKAKELVELCRAKLREIESDISSIDLEDDDQ